MTFETITVAEADGVVTLTLNRPDKLNALNVTMGEELCAALEAVGKSSTARVLVVTGAGRMFSAGGDLASMDQVVSSAAAIDHSVRIYCEVARRLRELPLPAVAKVNGDAFGGSLGIIMDAGVSYLLPRLVGVPKAIELLFLGETIVAAEAERIGLVHRAVPAAQLDQVTDGIVKRLAAGPPVALRHTKRALYEGLTRDLAADFEYEAYVQSLCFQSEDHREGLRAFREKRAPTFKGR